MKSRIWARYEYHQRRQSLRWICWQVNEQVVPKLSLWLPRDCCVFQSPAHWVSEYSVMLHGMTVSQRHHSRTLRTTLCLLIQMEWLEGLMTMDIISYNSVYCVLCRKYNQYHIWANHMVDWLDQRSSHSRLLLMFHWSSVFVFVLTTWLTCGGSGTGRAVKTGPFSTLVFTVQIILIMIVILLLLLLLVMKRMIMMMSARVVLKTRHSIRHRLSYIYTISYILWYHSATK